MIRSARSPLSLLLATVLVPAFASAQNSRPSLFEPSLSPDGREIAFVSGGDIWTVPAAGGDAHLLVSNPATESRPQYSPDGKSIAFGSTRTGNGDIYVLDLATSTLKRITYDDAPEVFDGWSRDGKWLYFSSSARDISGMNDVYRVPARGGTPMQVAADRYASEYWGAASPDGSTLAITARGTTSGQWWRNGHSHLDESEIWLVRTGETNPVYSQVTAPGAKSAWAMWSPNGKTLYYMSDRNGPENLYSRSVAGGEERQLTSFRNGRVLWPSIAADGSAIVFERDMGVWRYDIARNEAKPVQIALRGSPAGASIEHVTLTNGFQSLSLAPDGKKFAFIAHGEVFAAGARDSIAATRVTNSPGPESSVTWTGDSHRVIYLARRNGPTRLYTYDFATRKESALTSGGGDTDDDAAPRVSPDGKHLLYFRGGRELRVLDIGTREDRRIVTDSFDRAPFMGSRDATFSPDSHWIAYVAGSGRNDFNNVFVVPVEGGTPRQISFLGNSGAGNVAWSPDGKYIMYVTGQRTEQSQVARIDLVLRTPRFQEDQFRDLFTPNSPAAPRPGDTTHRAPTRDTTALTMRDSASRDSTRARAAKHTDIVFDGIRTRLTLLPLNLDVNAIEISPDGKQLLVTGSRGGQQNLYTVSLDEAAGDNPTPRQLTSNSTGKGEAQWSPDSKEVWFRDAGRIASVNVESRTVKNVSTQAELDVDFAAEKGEVFDQAWTYLRDQFFDPRFNGVDWKAEHDRFLPYAMGSRTGDELRRVVNLMIGELNSSHSGISGPGGSSTTGRLGIRLDRASYERDGTLRVSEVIPLSPAAIAGVKVGDVVTSVDGKTVARDDNLDALLQYTIGKRVALGVTGNGGVHREIAMRPVNLSTEKALLYRSWVESRRAYVDRISGGKVGYVHMIDMGESSLNQLYIDLDAENQSKDAVIIDIRNNNGGFVNSYALDVFTRRPFLTMTSRGHGPTPARGRLGQRSLERPTVLVVNQHTLSDGEDFTEGYRALGVGKVVGEPTAGWIIFTSNVPLLDGSQVRLPGSRITDLSGKDMEMHPRPVDVNVVRPVGESYSGRDSQLDAAVKALER